MNELKLKDNLTSLELVEQINIFREKEGKENVLLHKNLMAIIRDEFKEEINELKIQPVEYKDKKGELRPMFVLTLNQAKQLLARESRFVRKAVIEYIDKLEQALKNKYQVPSNFKEALLLAVQQQEEIEKLEQKIEQDRPRVAFAETIEKASDCILVREFAKLLANEDIHIGEKKIYKQLREWGYILLYSTEPTQRAVQQGLFKIKETVISTIKGDMLGKTTLITGKGQLFLLDKFKKKVTEN